MQRVLASFSILVLLAIILGAYPEQTSFAANRRKPIYAPAPAQSPVQQGGVRQNSLGAGSQGSQAENVLIILDASYSMSENLQGNDTKMAVAKRTILQVLQNVPPNVNVGLRVYGTSTNSFTACRATELLVPIGPNNRNQISSKLLSVKPTGATPISYTLIKAVNEDFLSLPGKKTVILVSDGIETCANDPCSVAVDMMRNGVDVKINVVGFGIHDLEATKQLRCIALSTFGKFHTANTAAELVNSLNNAMNVDTKVEGRIILPGQSSP